MSAALDLTINDSILWGNNRFVVNAIDSEQIIITNMTTKQIRGVPLHTVQMLIGTNMEPVHLHLMEPLYWQLMEPLHLHLIDPPD